MAQDTPSLPNAIIMQAGVKFTFPVRDEDFHLNNVRDVESYELESQVSIPLVDSQGGSPYNGFALNIGNNARVLRTWFRAGKKGILLWDKAQPIGSELGIYYRA